MGIGSIISDLKIWVKRLELNTISKLMGGGEGKASSKVNLLNAILTGGIVRP